MTKEDVLSCLTCVRQINGLLGLIDSYMIKEDFESITLSQVLESWGSKYGLRDFKTHSFFNQYQMISSLLAYVILPKEKFNYDISDNVQVKDVSVDWGLESFENQDMKLRNFIRLLRNGVAHGNIEVSEDLKFKIWNRKKDNTIDMQIVFTEKDIRKFVQSFDYWALTKKLSIKNSD